MMEQKKGATRRRHCCVSLLCAGRKNEDRLWARKIANQMPELVRSWVSFLVPARGGSTVGVKDTKDCTKPLGRWGHSSEVGRREGTKYVLRIHDGGTDGLLQLLNSLLASGNTFCGVVCCANGEACHHHGGSHLRLTLGLRFVEEANAIAYAPQQSRHNIPTMMHTVSAARSQDLRGHKRTVDFGRLFFCSACPAAVAFRCGTAFWARTLPAASRPNREELCFGNQQNRRKEP